MATVYSSYVLYNDVPQRHYRQIAAKSDEASSFVQIWEGTILQVEPFEHENSDSEIMICTSVNDAIATAEREHELSLKNGWRDYNRHLP